MHDVRQYESQTQKQSFWCERYVAAMARLCTSFDIQFFNLNLPSRNISQGRTYFFLEQLWYFLLLGGSYKDVKLMDFDSPFSSTPRDKM